MSESTGREFFALLAEGHTPANTGGLVDLTPAFKVGEHTLKSAIFIAPATGVAGIVEYTIAGTYAVGDQIRVTVQSNLTSAQKFRKSYLVEVEPGDDNDALAAKLAAKMNIDVANTNAPFASAVVAANVVTLTQKGDDKRGITSDEWTDSAAGTIVGAPTATTISEGQPSDLVDAGIPAEDINLASYDTVRIVYEADSAVPFIDSKGAQGKEIFWYGTPGS
jgi:hypothetical protein